MNVTVNLNKMKSGKNLLNMNFDVFQTIQKNVFATIELHKELSNNPNSTNYKFIDRQIVDVCAYSNGKQKYLFYGAIMKNLKNYGNLTTYCPFEKVCLIE